VDDLGDTATATDDRTELTSYVYNTAGWVVGGAYQHERYTGYPAVAANLVERTQFGFDGAAPNVAPTAGNLTLTRSFTNTSANQFSDTRTTFWRGKPAVVTDALNHASTTAFESFYGYPTQFTNALNQSATMKSDPRFGAQILYTDPNQRQTTTTYDALGRTVGLWNPTEPVSGPATEAAVYTLDPAKTTPPSIRTAQLSSVNGVNTLVYSWAFSDGLGRGLSTQTYATTSGHRYVSNQSDDGSSRVVRSTAVRDEVGDPAVYSPVPSTSTLISYHQFLYDGLDRPTSDALYSNGTQQFATTTAYNGLTATVTQPPGTGAGAVTDTRADGHGQVVATVEHNGASLFTTSSAYDGAGRLLSITDAAQHVTSMGYDKAGRKISQSDPDAGPSSYQYDAVGNVQFATDALGQTVYMQYDPLNRPVARRKTNSAGALLASWSYDAAGNIGLPASETSYDDSPTPAAFVHTNTSYDADSRPTAERWTIPATAATVGVSGTWAMAQTFDPVGHQKSKTYPGANDGSLGEIVTSTYDGWGRSFGLTSSTGGTYVASSGYDANGHLTSRSLGASVVTQAAGFNPVTQRLGTLQATATAGPLQNKSYTYNQDGTISRVTDNADGGQIECYTYDQLQRLTRAFTGNSTCSSYKQNVGTFPYDQAFQYDTGGLNNFVSAAGRAYTYADPAHLHAVTQAGTDVFTYDASGNQRTRTVGGVTSTLTWDHEGQLAAFTRGTAVSNYRYGPSGERLVRQDGTTVTLYLAGIFEATSVNGGAVAKTSYYALDGAAVAMLENGTLSFLVGDHLGSSTATIASNGSALQRQRYLPFGGVRGGAATLATDRGFGGQTADDATLLIAMGARYYDPAAATFISPDMITGGSIARLHGYAWADNNPIVNTDPSGTCPDTFGPPGHACNSSDLNRLDNAPTTGGEAWERRREFAEESDTLYTVVRPSAPVRFVRGFTDRAAGAAAALAFSARMSLECSGFDTEGCLKAVAPIVGKIITDPAGFAMEFGGSLVNAEEWQEGGFFQWAGAETFDVIAQLGGEALANAGAATKAGAAAHSEEALPALRQAYVDDVASIADNVAAWEKAGADARFVAQEAWADRRALGIQYKGLTPPEILEVITTRNIARYGDPLGPSIGWLRAKGKTWQEIIESAMRAGGKGLRF
jgi:RHS repeat-associated protein